MTEFSWRAVILGAIFGALFGAVSVYVGLRAGLTVSASIPISVLSISILRAFGKSTILENNIVQTTGSAGESVAAGVIFTLPALIGNCESSGTWRIEFSRTQNNLVHNAEQPPGCLPERRAGCGIKAESVAEVFLGHYH